MRMARDPDVIMRQSAWHMLAILVQPDAQLTSQMLLRACPDVATTAIQVCCLWLQADLSPSMFLCLYQ